ncbi:hypothetical protein THARTR1_06471 [Trichoderma harzianum]|uniref:Uncharacterized protein n=1 Tax=Trichoderma harzianum TaxID=5544 RepID=A0A2K0U5A7_TRIHA|nr:hypothetical protein THARTR1_06471 [Trichoderma harzianum]
MKMWEPSNEQEDEEDEEKESEEKEEEDSEIDLEAEYWHREASTDNPSAIGCVMILRLQREKGVKIMVQYPDIYGRPPE